MLDVDPWPLRSRLLFIGVPSGGLPTAIGRSSPLTGVGVTTPRGARARARFVWVRNVPFVRRGTRAGLDAIISIVSRRRD